MREWLGLPNRLKLLRQKGPRILDKIQKAKGPMAFLDESFLSPAQGPDSFYLLVAVVLEKSEVIRFRNQIRESVSSDRWHTTEAARTDVGRQKIRELAHLIAQSASCVVAVIDEIDEHDKTGELARTKLTRALLEELASNHVYATGAVIYEKRTPGAMRSRDELVLNQLSKSDSVASKLAIWGISTKSEPLLWAPDVLAWSYRQAYFEKDASFFQDLEKVTTLIKP